MRECYKGKSRQSSSGGVGQKQEEKKAQGEQCTGTDTHGAEVVSHDDIHQITGPSRQLHRTGDRSSEDLMVTATQL